MGFQAQTKEEKKPGQDLDIKMFTELAAVQTSARLSVAPVILVLKEQLSKGRQWWCWERQKEQSWSNKEGSLKMKKPFLLLVEPL